VIPRRFKCGTHLRSQLLVNGVPYLYLDDSPFFESLFALLKLQRLNRAKMASAVAPIPPPFYSPYLDDQVNKINSKPVPWEVSRD
jgi:hypothetical protein